jgi:hypothetical protein
MGRASFYWSALVELGVSAKRARSCNSGPVAVLGQTEESEQITAAAVALALNRDHWDWEVAGPGEPVGRLAGDAANGGGPVWPDGYEGWQVEDLGHGECRYFGSRAVEGDRDLRHTVQASARI